MSCSECSRMDGGHHLFDALPLDEGSAREFRENRLQHCAPAGGARFGIDRHGFVPSSMVPSTMAPSSIVAPKVWAAVDLRFAAFRGGAFASIQFQKPSLSFQREGRSSRKLWTGLEEVLASSAFMFSNLWLDENPSQPCQRLSHSRASGKRRARRRGSSPSRSAGMSTRSTLRPLNDALGRLLNPTLPQIGNTDGDPLKFIDAAFPADLEGETAGDPHKVPLVKADKIGIEQVLNNIVANAIDAAAERGDARGRVVIRVFWVVAIGRSSRSTTTGLASLPRWRRVYLQAARNGAWAHSKSANRKKARGSALVATPLDPEGTRFVGRAEHQWTRPGCRLGW